MASIAILKESNNKDSEKVEVEVKEVVGEIGHKPQLLEDVVQKERRKSPATEDNASKDGGAHAG